MSSIITSAVADYGTRKLLTSKAVQENLYSYSAAMLFSEVDSSTLGVYRSPFTNIGNIAQETVSNNEYTAVEASTDADVLPINERAVFAEKIGGFDEVSFATGSLIKDRAMNAAKVMSQSIDRYVVNKAVSEVGSTIGDAGAVGSTTPWTATTSNALDIVNTVVEVVNFNEGFADDKFVLADTKFASKLVGYFQGTGNNVADETIRKGIPYVGTLAGGVKVFQSNNLPTVTTITLGATPTNGDTVTINGVVFTFVSSIGTTPGNVLIGASATASATNFETLWNDVTTTTATGVALSLNNQNKIKNLHSTITRATAVLTINAKAAVTITETFASGSNTVATYRKMLAGSMNAIKVFMPTRGMKYQEKDVTAGFDGTEIFMRQFFNSMTETRKKDLTVSVLTN